MCVVLLVYYTCNSYTCNTCVENLQCTCFIHVIHVYSLYMYYMSKIKGVADTHVIQFKHHTCITDVVQLDMYNEDVDKIKYFMKLSILDLTELMIISFYFFNLL